MIELTKPNRLKSAKYLYAIAHGAAGRTYDICGIDEQPVYTIPQGSVAAVASDCCRQKIRPERAHLNAHKEVLKRLMLEDTVLPIAFGTIADNLKAVRRMLSACQQDLLEQLKSVEGKVEMGLRVVCDVPNIFEYFIEIHSELRAARDRLLGGNRVPRQEEKIQLGAFFERLLNDDREAHGATIEEVLAPCCVEIKRSPARNLNEVVNLSCLVERPRQKELEEAVFSAAHLFDNNFSFDVNGPWAPHSFVEMDIQLNSPKRIPAPC